MINDQRSLARLPLHIFTNLSSHEEGDHQKSPEVMRNSILKKLENAGKILKKPFPHDASINTVGELMALSHTTLLRLLDPLLVSGKLEIMTTCLLCEHHKHEKSHRELITYKYPSLFRTWQRRM